MSITFSGDSAASSIRCCDLRGDRRDRLGGVESTYGDREHAADDTVEVLAAVIGRTVARVAR
ncbi:MAG: hypothetical protein R2713_23800 [Ilumatobacteraceae bacterium]